MSADVSGYIGRITSEHADKPTFVATVAASVQPFADILATLNSIPTAFDLDNAEGAQLDIIGQWVGVSRNVKSALTGVYFSFDIDGVGFDEGVIWAPGDPLTGLIALPDDIFLILLKAKIAANQWDGTIPGAYAAYNDLLVPLGYHILIQDNGNMTMTLAMTSTSINPTVKELFTGGYLDLRPAGVLIDSYLTPSVDGAPFFGFDAENSAIAGYDVGAFATALTTSTTPSSFALTDTFGVAVTTDGGSTILIL